MEIVKEIFSITNILNSIFAGIITAIIIWIYFKIKDRKFYVINITQYGLNILLLEMSITNITKTLIIAEKEITNLNDNFETIGVFLNERDDAFLDNLFLSFNSCYTSIKKVQACFSAAESYYQKSSNVLNKVDIAYMDSKQLETINASSYFLNNYSITQPFNINVIELENDINTLNNIDSSIHDSEILESIIQNIFETIKQVLNHYKIFIVAELKSIQLMKSDVISNLKKIIPPDIIAMIRESEEEIDKMKLLFKNDRDLLNTYEDAIKDQKDLYHNFDN